MDQNKVERVVRIFARLVVKMDAKFRLPGGGIPHAAVSAGLDDLEKLFPMGMSDQRITDFMVYQVYRYVDNIIGKAPTHFDWRWCWGKTAIEKYRNQYFGDGNPRIDYYIDQWLDSIDVKRQVITDYIAGPKPNKWRQYIEMPSDELVKRRLLNTEAGLVLCSMKTLGWSPGSNACSECEFTAKCKETTTNRYPELMRLRLEDGNN